MSVRDFFSTKKRKLEDDEDVSNTTHDDKVAKTETSKKPILVILPGASGALAKDFKEFLLPRLREVDRHTCGIIVRPAPDAARLTENTE